MQQTRNLVPEDKYDREISFSSNPGVFLRGHILISALPKEKLVEINQNIGGRKKGKKT